MTVGVGVSSTASEDGVKVGVAVEETDVVGVKDGVVELVKDTEGVML